MGGFGLLFPGQGSQHVGMGGDLFEARPDLLGEAADEVLGFSLRARCLDGPEEELTRTEVAQPALYALSYALWEETSGLLPAPAGAAGHSLGEYTALAASGVVGYRDGLRLVAARGRAMAAAADATPSGMAALLGGDDTAADSLATARRDEGGSLWVANRNAPGQVVVAGGEADLEWLEQNAAATGVRRVVRLAVAGAFHTPLMEGAVAELKRALAAVEFSTPAFPVWSNADAAPYTADVAGHLLRQLTAPVRFAGLLADMAGSGMHAFLHVGPGDVTAGLARRTVSDAEALVVSDLAMRHEAAAAIRRSIQ